MMTSYVSLLLLLLISPCKRLVISYYLRPHPTIYGFSHLHVMVFFWSICSMMSKMVNLVQMVQAKEDGDKPGLEAMLQKVLQLYASRVLSKRSYAKKGNISMETY